MNRASFRLPKPFLLAIPALVFAVCYLLTGNQLFTFDALTHALAAETNEIATWFHGNHPLYPSLAVFWYRLEKWLGYTGYSVYSLERFHSLLMCGAIYLFVSALSLRISPRRAVVAGFFFGSTYVVWFHAVDAFAVGITPFFSSLLLFVIIKFDQKAALSFKDLGVLTACSTTYVLAHGIAIFHIPAVALWVYLKNRTVDFDSAWKSALGYCGLATTVTIGMYFFIFLLFTKNPQIQGFLSWIIGYAAYNGVENFFQSEFWAVGFWNTLLGLWKGWYPLFLFPWPPGNQPMFFLSCAFSIVMAAVLVGRATILGWRRELNQLDFLLLGWGVLTMGFLAFWSPGHTGFRLHVLVPWLAWLFLNLNESKKIFLTQAVVTTLLFALNFSGPFYYGSFISNNRGFAILDELSRRIQPGDYLLCEENEIPNAKGLRSYFFPQINGGPIGGRLFEFREKNFEPLLKSLRLRAQQGRRIFMTEYLLMPDVQAGIDSAHRLDSGSTQAFIDSFHCSFFTELSSGLRIFHAVPKHRTEMKEGESADLESAV